MISSNSLLLHIPKSLNKKQVLFLSGIRYAAEFASFAYVRLTKALTEIALDDKTAETQSNCHTAIFIDAWAIIDAFDHFISLLKLFPNNDNSPSTNNETPSELAQTARKLRNVADHLALQADKVVSKKGTALGVLSWYTVKSENEGFSCAMIPGAVPNCAHELVNPADRSINIPTDLVHISAGSYKISLSELILHMSGIIQDLERQLNEQFPTNLNETQVMASDLIVKSLITFPT